MQKKSRFMARSALFAAMLCILSPVAVPVGPVPVTMATFAVMFAGTVLAKKQAVAAVLIYILTGAIGLPVFANARGGLAVLIGPAGGYLWAYPLMSWMIAACRPKKKISRLYETAVTMLFCILSVQVCYLLGTIWFMVVAKTTVKAAIVACVLPFIPFDLMKAAAAAWIGIIVRQRVEMMD